MRMPIPSMTIPRAVLLAVLVASITAVFTLGAAATSSPARSEPATLGAKGPFDIGFTSFVVQDPTRPGDGGSFATRPIPVYVWYPVDPETVGEMSPDAVIPLDPLYQTDLISTSSDWEAFDMDPAYQELAASASGPFPLLMFSPGWGGPAWMHMSIGTRLASHGFVVAVLYHFGDQWWPWEPPFDHVAVASWNRPRDISFALTELLARNQTPGDLLAGTIRPEQIASGGWSLGGYASMVLAGGDDNVAETFESPEWVEWFGPPPAFTSTPSAPDSRIRTIVTLDGSNQILHFEELSRVSVPAMGMGEEWTMLAIDPGWASWQARQHAAFSGKPNYRVDVYNTIHQSFWDIYQGANVLGALGIWSPADVDWWVNTFCVGYSPWQDVSRVVTQYMVAFLKHRFDFEPRVRTMLTPGYALTNEPLVEFFVTEKRSPRSIDENWPNWPDEFVYFAHQNAVEVTRGKMEPVGALRIARLPGGGHVVQPFAAKSTSLASFPTVVQESTQLSFTVQERASVELRLYDVRGRLVAKLASGVFAPGEHSVLFEPSRLPAGVYLLGLNRGGMFESHKLTILK